MTSETINFTPDLSVKIFDQRLPNPLMIAAGPLTERVEMAEKFLAVGVGAVVLNTVRLNSLPERRNRRPVPMNRWTDGKTSVFTADWGCNNDGYFQYWLDKAPALIDKYPGRVVLSVDGNILQDCVTVCQAYDQLNPLYLEVNVSWILNSDPIEFAKLNQQRLRTTLRTLKETGIKSPIVVKLAHDGFLPFFAQICQEAGASGIMGINMVNKIVMPVNVAEEKPLFIGRQRTGWGGRAILPIALTDLVNMKQNSALTIPVIAGGGAARLEGVVSMLMFGAAAVQMHTEVLGKGGQKGPEYVEELLLALNQWMQQKGYKNIASMQGAALRQLKE